MRKTAIWFGSFGLALLVTTRTVIPGLVALGVAPRIAWFAAGAPVFFAMLGMVVWQLRRERSRWTFAALRLRLRVRPMQRRDWALAGIALAFTGIVTPLVLATGIDPAPSFLQVEPVRPSERTLLLCAWLPFFAANILGEELLWRGVLLPRHEQTFGRNAWVVHASGWLLFHVCFGPGMLLVTAPLIFSQSWACQRSGNTTVGIFLHGLVNGGGFIAITFLGLS
ncbi:MAG TPA: CPBP family intramembrane glutamic endopeptidase [Nannocystaceae bacterium]|nr:CPBP family intramembrane glutamic endopeptidase [Nannocystaceae bacterium]